MEDLFPKQPPSEPVHIQSQTLVAPVDKQAALAMAHQERRDAKEMMQQLAGEESVSQWASAIALWLQQHSDSPTVSLVELQQGLGMPVVGAAEWTI